MTALYRAEAIEGQRQRWLGEITLVRPVGLAWWTAWAVLVAVALGGWLVVGEYTRKVRVPGLVVPERGLLRIVTPEPALVRERRVGEGQAVRAGDVMFVLSAERSTREGGEQQRVQQGLAERRASLQASLGTEAELQRTRAAAIGRRLDELARETQQLDAEARLQQQRLALADAALARLESLRGEQFATTTQVQAKQEEQLALQAQLKTLERERAALSREAAALEGERRELPLRLQARTGELQRELQQLGRESARSDAQREILVRAPQDGVVGAVAVEPGQWASPQAALASLLPAGVAMQAQLYAPSSAIGFVREAQPVQLRVAAFPFQKFGHQAGQVVQVSRTPLQAAELAALPLAATAAEPLYRITVALQQPFVMAYGRPQPLVAGMQLEADVLLERRRLIEWLFAPLIGLADRV